MTYYSLDKARLFSPDRSEYMGLREFKWEYVDTTGFEFKFTGCGWYITKTDSVLILPGHDGDDKFLFYFWNNTDVIESFKQVYQAPIQSRKT